MRLFIILSTLPIISAALNIVFYSSVIGQSHISFLSSVIDVLAKRGHIVDVVFARFNDVVNLKPISNVRRNFTYGYEVKGYYKSKSPHLQNAFIKPPRDLVDVQGFDFLALELCEVATKSADLLDFLKSGKYDIGFTNDYDPCGVIMLNAASVPSIAGLVPTPMFQSQIVSAGLPTPTSIYGTTACSEHDGSMYDRIFHLIRSAYNLYYWWPTLYSKFDTLTMSVFGEHFPNVEQLEREIDVFFVNSNEIIEKPKPISNKIKYIGGLGIKKAKPLSQNIDRLVNIPSRGVVIFSFGTQVLTKRIPSNIRRNFVEAFKKFPDFTFLWKYDNMTNDSAFSEEVANVHRLEWLPQTDLLHNPHLKLFISHMGLNSYIETSEAGVPVLSIPLFVDQQNNAQNAADREIGIILNRNELSVENLVSALTELLTNPKYGENAKIISKMMKEKPGRPEDILVEWTEYVAKNPGLNKVINLPWQSTFHYYSIDVIITLLFVLSTAFYVCFKFYKILAQVSISLCTGEKVKIN